MEQEKYEGDERRKWHIKKEISIDNLLAFIAAVFAVLAAYYAMDKRVSILENDLVAQNEKDARQDSDAMRYQQRIDTSLQEMNRKLDRLIERR